MNIRDIANKLSKETELSSIKSKEFVEDFIGIVRNSLIERESVHIRGFGTFDIGKRKKHAGIHPTTGKKITIPEVATARFHPCQTLKQAVK